MKKIFTLFFTLSLAAVSYGQLKITEISYNPPESGSDSTEYVELLNVSGASVNLNGYQFTSGFVYTFPNISLAADSYIVVAVDSVAMLNRFGVTTYQWTSGGLSNGGEPIALKDASGNLVDSLRYDDNAPWPTSPDSDGTSLVYCDTSLDSRLGSSWLASTNFVAGQFINGHQVYGSPGRVDSVCTDTTMPANVVIPHYSIAMVTSEDTLGVADSNGVSCSISGVVYGGDLSGTSSSSNGFTVIDATAGIAIFKAGGFTPAYTVTEGDSVTLWGSISQFNGLTQLSPDSITVHKQGVALNMPRLVTDLDETTESDLIRIDSVRLRDTSQWPAVGSSSNIDIITVNNDTLTLRIDRDTDVEDSITTGPMGYFNVIGIGGQFDFSSPLTSGYQIVPRFYTDILVDTTSCNAPTALLASNIGSDTTDVSWNTDGNGVSWNVLWGTGATPSDTAANVMDSSYTITGLSSNTSYNVWVQQMCSNGASMTAGPFNFTTLNPVGINEVNGSESSFVVYPNPNGGDQVFFNQISTVSLRNMMGQIIKTEVKVKSMDISELTNGIYFLERESGEVVRFIVK